MPTRTETAVLVMVTCALMALVGCGRSRSWEGHTLSVQYSWDPNTRTRIIRITDAASGADIRDPQLTTEIRKEANRELPRWVASQRLTRAAGVFHVTIARRGAVQIAETVHGVEGAHVGFVTDPDVSPEMMAAHEGNLAKLTTLVEAGGSVNAKDQRGDTALMAAVGSHNIEVLRFLLKHGADIKMRNEDGDSALTLSVMSGQVDMTKELTEHGARLDCSNPADRATFDSENRRNRMPGVLDKIAVNCHSSTSR